MADDEAREDEHETAPEPVAPDDLPKPDDEVAAALVERFAGSVFDRSHGQPVVYVDRAVFADVARFLHDEQQFTMCVDITATDHLLDGERYAPAELAAAGMATERFEVIANFLSHVRNRRVRVICAVPDADAKVPSSSRDIPISPGSSCPTTGMAIPCARTTRRRASP
jgi:NADH:ubiquinone oxidoreductase subunit C